MAAPLLYRDVCAGVALLDVIHAWLACPYVPYGRDSAGVDCWGLARQLRRALRGDWLPAYDAVAPGDAPAMTQATSQMLLAGWVECAPRVGALAVVWRSGWCRHVGIVIEIEGRLAVMDTTRKTGPRWRYRADFEARHGEVRYYDAA